MLRRHWLNSKQVSLWIFNLSGQFNFVKFCLRLSISVFYFLIIGLCDLVQFVYLFLFTHFPWPGQMYTVWFFIVQV